MVEEKNPSRDTVQISGHVTLQNVSYDKDVVEIRLAGTVDSKNCGGNFVKDVCVDEGALLHPKITVEKTVDKRSSPNFICHTFDTNSDINKDDSRKSVHELKPEAAVQVDFARDCNKEKEKQHSSGKEYNPEDQISTGYIAGDPPEKKISLQELLRLESAEESRHASAKNSESSEKYECSLHEEAVGQTPKDANPDVQTILTNTSDQVGIGGNSSGCSGTMSEDHEAAVALDVREPHKIDRYNPSVDHRSLEDTSVPECPIPGITHAASTDSICDVDNVVSDSEPGLDALSTSSSEIQTSEKVNDHSESAVSKAVTGAADETAVAAPSSPNSAEPSDAHGENQGKHVGGGGAANQMHSVDTEGAVSNSPAPAQDDSVIEQTEPGSSKLTARIGNDDANFSGPSIMSGPVSMSGHIAYSGNISLRSDSSTTSTRSFAFPVLQREWISSPVRMAKAERRRTRLHCAWRKGLICCKF